MTIIQPRKKGFNKINWLIAGFAVILTSFALGGVFVYNELVNLRHDVNKSKTDLSKTEVENAELKNHLYGMTDAKNLEVLAQTYSLILEQKPSYFKEQAVAFNN